MFHIGRIGLLAVLAVLLSASASAGLIAGITIDENGNGLYVDPLGTVHSMAYGVGQDPGPGGLNNVLFYILPFIVTQGDVGLTESGVPSDYLRFNGDGRVFFYSDSADGADALADTPGFPGAFYQNLVSIPEVGPEGANGAVYTPLLGQPGFVDSDLTVTYNFLSDTETPEPGTLLLVGLGLAGLIGKVTVARKAR